MNIKSQVRSIREKIRSDVFNQPTSGVAPKVLQGNLVILESKYSEEFLEFCQLNKKPCPVIGVSNKGEYHIPELGDIDIRTDIPEYYIFKNGSHTLTTTNILSHWQKDFVAIVLGCSYSFEDAIQCHGYSIRNIEESLNVSMYNTNIAVKSTKNFSGNIVVSMRPFKKRDTDAIIDITSPFDKAHGSPIHIGNPSLIGIKDIAKPDYGDAVTILEDEVPVFWGCGVTSQAILRRSELPFFITHAPGKMLITDIVYR